MDPPDQPSNSCCAHAEEITSLAREVAELRRQVADLRAALLALRSQDHNRGLLPTSRAVGRKNDVNHADQRSSGREKIALYRALFVGRDDVYARRWENPRKGTSGWAPAHRGDWRTPRDEREYLPLTDAVLAAHLEGRETIGLYPLLTDDTCRLLAVDFDKTTWQLDALAYMEVAHAAGVPTAVELSRSGEGAHVWTFFTSPIAAAAARSMGAALLREAMALRGEIDLDSYDRFFPSQDYLPDRGFGNLIALPLHGRHRRENMTTVFVDPSTFQPHPDQFAFLSSVERMTPAQVRTITEKLQPVVVGPEALLYRPTVRSEPKPPPVIQARLAGMLAVRRAGIPPSRYTTLKHLATLHNPQFHKNENLRLSNHATPRFIRCYTEDLEHLYLPRGLTEQAGKIIEEAGSRLDVEDGRPEPAAIDPIFTGDLRDPQAAAVEKLVETDLGVLEAPPGAGKTVIACAVIAAHRTPTLVLVDRKPLLDQWRQRIHTHLSIDAGQIGGGKNRPTKTVDIAMLQTVTRSEQPSELLDGYGLVVVDECHHVPAPTVERAVRDLPVRRWLGLTATPQRPDGLKDIMVMQCGPIRHRVRQAENGVARTLNVHHTDLELAMQTDGLNRGEVLALAHAALVESKTRTQQICHDVTDAMQRSRQCLVLTGRTEHVETLADALRQCGQDPLVLYGSMKPKERRAVHERLADDEGEVLLVATDRYIGEGFDCPRLDTLFLTFPISAPDRVTQYAGRILRDHPGKQTVEVHDYVDTGVPMLAAMYRRRQGAYKKLGFGSQRSKSAAQPELSLDKSPSAPRPPTRSTDASLEPTTAEVRAWARQAGLVVPARGRLPERVWRAYRERAQSGERYALAPISGDQ